MSGTFDNRDVALIKTDGEDHVKFKFSILKFLLKILYRSSVLKILIFLTKAINKRHIEVIKKLLIKTNIKNSHYVCIKSVFQNGGSGHGSILM